MKSPIKYCAIYTRKSTEEGLDMEFNTLDAQREACAAYIVSQKADGWSEVKNHYDDGGYSGGNMDRPGLKQLLADIEAGKVHIVVVYKIDRLTRSLMDFSKLVEAFDKYGVTFVSVTQSFNTTTSMGRLTLNVLLSFAQFEREVIGERVRDKIAASKKKGMWMGGAVPIGYKADDKKLVPDPEYAEKIKYVFERYWHWGCVSKLKAELDYQKIYTRTWLSKKGIVHGESSFSRGILYKILRNPVYIGRVAHKGDVYEGQHEPIIPFDLWEKVQLKLAEQAAQPRGKRKAANSDLLKGILFDPDGNFYSPSYTIKSGKQYRYYISQNLLQYRDHPKGIIARLPASDLESLVCEAMINLTTEQSLSDIFGLNADDETIRHVVDVNDLLHKEILAEEVVSRVTIYERHVKISISTEKLREYLMQTYCVELSASSKSVYEIDMPFVTGRAKTGAFIIMPPHKVRNIENPFDRPDAEIRAWIQGVIWRDEHFGGISIHKIATREDVSKTHILKYINKSFF